MASDLYLDCSSGISGNMFLGALLDLGLPVDDLESMLRQLPLEENWSLQVEPQKRANLAATHVMFLVDDTPADDHHAHHGRHLHPILDIIRSARLPREVEERSADIFTRLAEAEAAVHGTTVEKIHFHEVGALDAILDIVGAACGLHLLGIRSVAASTVSEGQGTVRCAHGEMPIPVPAVVQLLKGVPFRQIDVPAELVTPTGAAILRSITTRFGPMPPFSIERIGTGCGSRDTGSHPNVLRAFLGTWTAQAANSLPSETILLLTTNLDQSTPECLADLTTLLMKEGALDSCLIPVVMKKGRPAHQLQVMCRHPSDAEKLARLIFRQTGTLGIRFESVERWALERRSETVETPWGPVRVKTGLLDGNPVLPQAEFEDCRDLAQAHDLPLRQVMQAAAAAVQSSSIRE